MDLIKMPALQMMLKTFRGELHCIAAIQAISLQSHALGAAVDLQRQSVRDMSHLHGHEVIQ